MFLQYFDNKLHKKNILFLTTFIIEYENKQMNGYLLIYQIVFRFVWIFLMSTSPFGKTMVLYKIVTQNILRTNEGK